MTHFPHHQLVTKVRVNLSLLSLPRPIPSGFFAYILAPIMDQLDKYGALVDRELEFFLPSEERVEASAHLLESDGSSKSRTTPRWRKSLAFQSSLVLNLILLLVATWLSIELAKRSSNLADQPSAPYSPAQEAIAFENRPVDGLVDGSDFTGYPSPKSDAAWNALMDGINLKIYPEEMDQLGITSLELKDGTGFLAAMGVYHELHCIKRLRKWFYRDHYYPNATELEYNERMTHAEHCLEFIRQAAVCHGDITITPFRWIHDAKGKVIEPTTKEGALHRCVKWDKLADWAKARRIDLFDHNVLAPEED